MSQDQDNAAETTNKKPENSDIVNRTEPAAKVASVQKPVTKPAPSTNTLTKKEAEPQAFEKGIIEKLVGLIELRFDGRTLAVGGCRIRDPRLHQRDGDRCFAFHRFWSTASLRPSSIASPSPHVITTSRRGRSAR